MTSFDRARYAGDPPPADACAFCTRALSGSYYRVGQHLACEPCAQRAESLVPPDSHKAYSRAVLFGVGAAIVGCIGYALFQILSGIVLGYLAIGVGYLVGWTMKKGSGGLGGRRYQITAALLTYAAVAVAFVPIAMHEMAVHRRGVSQPATQQAQANDAQAAQSDAAKATGKPASAQKVGFGGFLLAVLMLLGVGLISPFLMLSTSIAHGVLNLFIIYLGVQFAWKAMVSPRIVVDGPFATAPAADAVPRDGAS